jgi:hypothetical protein
MQSAYILRQSLTCSISTYLQTSEKSLGWLFSGETESFGTTKIEAASKEGSYVWEKIIGKVSYHLVSGMTVKEEKEKFVIVESHFERGFALRPTKHSKGKVSISRPSVDQIARGSDCESELVDIKR